MDSDYSKKFSTKSVVARWDIPLSDGVYCVEFEHGTGTGMRAIFVNGRCIRRQDFKFSLIGEEHFKVSDANCTVQIKTINTMDYAYYLLVNGMPFEQFLTNQANQLKCWILPIDGQSVRIVLRLDTMEIFSNGERLESTGEFTDEGSETHFEVNETPCYIRVSNNSMSSGRRRKLTYTLFHGKHEVPEAAVDQVEIWDAKFW